MRLFIVTQFRLNSSINRVIEKTLFNIIYRYKLEIRINIVFIVKNNSFLGEVPAARQEVEL